MSEKLLLRIETGDLAGKRLEVGSGGLRFGRSSSNDVHVPDEELSRNHCYFEETEGVIRVTDLASANGTLLNGNPLGADPVELSAGDIVEAGATRIRVITQGEAEAEIDLGLGTSSAPAAAQGGTSAEPQRKRGLFSYVIWAVAGICAVGAVVCVFLPPPAEETAPSPVGATETEPVVKELYYEKTEADSEGIFRYELKLTPDGVLHVRIDDVPQEDRHVTKSRALDDRALAHLNEIVSFSKMRKIDREYAGPDTEPPKLESWDLKVVYSSRVRRVRIVNTQEPEAFKEIREKLEAFTKNELGVWAIQYSREKLIELAKDKVALGMLKWEDRDVNYGNLAQSITAYKEAFFYLETINPKPDFAAGAREGLDRAKAEHEKRYNNQRFLADRAINLGQWPDAQRELKVLLEMVPDRADERNREASAKLIDVERRMTKGGKR